MEDRPLVSAELASLPPGGDVERQAPAPASRTPDNSSTAFLDGLRGVAAFFVFIQHCIGNYDNNIHDHGFGQDGHWLLASMPFVRILFNGGNAAVAVFFVLSGYVLTGARCAWCATARGTPASGVWPRPWSAGPSVFMRQCLRLRWRFALLMHAPYRLVEELPWPKRKDDVFLEIMNWVVDTVKFFNPFRKHDNVVWYTYSLVVWTIPIELKGSMLVYGLAALHAFFTKLSPLKTVLFSFIAVVALLQMAFWTMGCFIAGMFLACVDVHALDITFLSRHCSRRARMILYHVAFVSGYYLLCQPASGGKVEYSLNTPGWRTLTRLIPAGYDKNQYYRFWTSWGSLLLVYATLRIPWLQSLLKTRPLRYLGRVSFMFYLIHLPMQYMVGDRVGRMFGPLPEDSPPTWWDNRLRVPNLGPPGFQLRFILAMAVMLPLDLVVADFLTKAVDMPCVRLGRRLTQWLGLENRVASRKAENSG
ncbi:hypothetical protein NEMBOFW57_009274 [Staphylotrichum longicolle]|uniref:Acyltransferase 3 domain-containing protein n=1 Tax=Staphylotrichum longicolle TaxID=669026 RepID=A0AAD4EP64_9PEZI|nr:hypothetical protein NEMBOFW57_009274 [Staphylotrichum longicolle]